MKFLAPVLMLTILAACNGSGKGNSKGLVSREFVQTPVGRAERGMVVRETTQGTTLNISYEASEEVNVSIGSASGTTTKVLVAILGDKLYFLEEEAGVERESAMITTEKAPTQREIDQAMSQPGSARVGDRYVTQSPGELETETHGEGANLVTVTATNVYSSSLSATNFYCDRIFSYGMNNIQVRKSGITTVLGNTSANTITSCLPKLDRDQLKDFDLSNVEFCDDADEKECVSNQDMSFLTADIQ